MNIVKTSDLKFDIETIKHIEKNKSILETQSEQISKSKITDLDYVKQKINKINKNLIKLCLNLLGLKYDENKINNLAIADLFDYFGKKTNSIYLNTDTIQITNFFDNIENIIKFSEQFEWVIFVKNLCIIYTNENITKIFDKSNNLDSFEFITTSYKQTEQMNRLILSNKIDDYLDNYCLNILDTFKSSDNDTIKKTTKINIYKLIIDNLRRTVVNKNNVIKIHSAIKQTEGDYIYKTINADSNKYIKCLEVGMACGTSAFYILSNLKSTLISVDPFQSTQWESHGIDLLKELDLNSSHELIQKKNFIALPEVLSLYGENSFDFIFIDGWHTFDYTLIDFFYASLLVRVSGSIVIDDALHPGVTKCVQYIRTNYPNFEKLDSPNTVASFKKNANDTREWNYHKNF